MGKKTENVNKRIQEVSKNDICGKRNAFKKDEKELQKRSNTVSQPSSSTQPMQDQN